MTPLTQERVGLGMRVSRKDLERLAEPQEKVQQKSTGEAKKRGHMGE